MIQGERVRLRACERQDLPLFVAWLNDAEVIRTLSVALPLSMTDEERWFENMSTSDPAEHIWVIEAMSEGAWKPIGNCAMMQINWINRSGGLGIFIGEKTFWNRGYGTEAMRLLVKFGFESLNLNRIWLDVFESNPRAIRVYEKVGFTKEGCKRQEVFKDGQYHDLYFMSILRSEYEAQKSTHY